MSPGLRAVTSHTLLHHQLMSARNRSRGPAVPLSWRAHASRREISHPHGEPWDATAELDGSLHRPLPAPGVRPRPGPRVLDRPVPIGRWPEFLVNPVRRSGARVSAAGGKRGKSRPLATVHRSYLRRVT